MASCRILSIVLVLTALFVGSAKATAPRSPVGHPIPKVGKELTLNNQRQEAAEDRAEIAFGIRKDNARHRYALMLKRCGVQSPSPQSECVEHARSLYEKSIDEADAAFQVSHARALMLGTTIH
jgi:hypothetical protein